MKNISLFSNRHLNNNSISMEFDSIDELNLQFIDE